MGKWIVLGLIGLGLIYLINLYNYFIPRKNNIDYALSSIDALLKKRFDLIPNLVAAVKAYMQHEREVLEKLVKLRGQYATANFKAMPVAQIEQIDQAVKAALTPIYASLEAYPNLKSSENVLQLQAALNEVEEQISAARRAYNAAVMEYNNLLEQFPSNLIANMLGYEKKASFSILGTERQPVDVKALFQA